MSAGMRSTDQRTPELDVFATSSSLSARLTALLQLIKNRSVHRSVGQPAFEDGLSYLLETATHSVEPRDRLLAVAAVARLGEVAKTLRPRITTGLRDALGERLGDPKLLDNPDDRYYIALGCRAAKVSWCTSYLAEAAVFEEAAEKARSEYLKQLLHLTNDLQSTFELLREPLQHLEPDTDSPGDSVGRRLRRVFAGLRQAMIHSQVEPTSACGPLLAEVAKTPFKKWQRPATEAVSFDLAEHTIALMHEFIRAKFSLATEPSIYQALYVARGWLPDQAWRRFSSSSPSGRLLVRDLREAIAILAKQDRADRLLADLLELAASSKDEARRIRESIARELPGLTTEIREWLLHGRAGARPVTDANSVLAAESRALSENILIADLLVAAEQLHQRGESARSDVLPEVAILAPQIAEELSAYMAHGAALVDAVKSLAKRRSLEVRGQPGELVEYSPLDHELVSGEVTVRRVRIRRPGVIQVRSDSLPIVVRKGLVEPV